MGTIKRVGSIVLRIGISAALLFMLFSKVDARKVVEDVRGADFMLLAGAFLLTCLINVICYFRWKMLLYGAGVRAKERKLVSSYCGGVFFNVCLPATFGGDFVRGFDLASHTRQAKEVTASIIVDRLSGYAGMMVVALTGVALSIHVIDDRRILLSIAVLASILAVALVVLFNEPIYSWVNSAMGGKGGKFGAALRGVHEQIYVFRNKKKLLLFNLFLSVLIQLIAPVSSYIIAVSMGLNVSLPYFLVFLPIVFALTALPISIGGAGVRELATVQFLAKVGIPRNSALALSLVGFAFVVIIALFAGGIYGRSLRPRRV